MALIPRTDLDVFRLNLGGNTFGWTSDASTSFEVLDAYVAAGGNFIDTADLYAVWVDGKGGTSEQIIGDWMTERGNHDDVIVATKVGGLPSRKGLGKANVEAALEDSLERLQTNVVDLYYLHYDDDTVAIEDQVETFHGLVESGRVRYLALSNFSPDRMRAWFETAINNNLSVPVAIQPQYSLVSRAEFESDFAPLANEFDVAVFPYSALASGFLTGKYRSEADLEGQARGGATAQYVNSDGLAVIDSLVEIAAVHQVEPATIALAWQLARGITAPIASASKPEQLPSLLASVNVPLTSGEVSQLDEASQAFA